ncbi:MAG: hypothetical protein ABI823_14440 [Bryobacteraceae bacterium]
MKMRMILMGVLCAAMSFAADVAGKWTAETQGRQGPMTQTFEFKVDGSKLTGTVAAGPGSTEIKDGKVDGDKITFTVTRTMGDRTFTQMYEGTVAGDELKLSAKTEGRPAREMTAKRVK